MLICFEADPLKIDQVMQIEAAPLYVNWVDVKLKLAIFRSQASNPALQTCLLSSLANL